MTNTSPGWATGVIPTAIEWNNAFLGKVDASGGELTSPTFKILNAAGDGAADDTAAIQAAVTAIPVSGGSLYIPPGSYVISSPIRLKSNTRIVGGGAGSKLVASAAWVDQGHVGLDPYCFFTNYNYAAAPIIDQNIIIENLGFDWSSHIAADAHTIRFNHARNVTVRGCYGNKGGDLISFIGVETGAMLGNSAYEHSNCPYDIWGGSTNIRVIGNYAESASVLQMVCFNGAEFGASSPSFDPNAALTSDGFVCVGNIFRNNNAASFGSITVDTLGQHCITRNIVIADNVLYGVTIAGRGTVNNVRVSGNVQFGNVKAPVIFTADSFTMTPTNIQITDNIIISPQIAGLDVIQCLVTGYVIDRNTVTGSNFVSCVSTTTFVGVVGTANNFSTGTDVPVRGSTFASTLQDVYLANGKFIQARDSVGNARRVALTTRLYYTGSSVGNGADLTEDTLQTFTIPAGLLANVGDEIRVRASGSFGATTDAKVARLRFGGVNFGGPVGSSASTLKWSINAVITKTGASTQSYDTTGSVANSSNIGTTSATATVTDTATIVVAIGGQNSTNSVAGSVTCQSFSVDLFRA